MSKCRSASCFLSLITAPLNYHRQRKELLNKLCTKTSVLQRFQPISKRVVSVSRLREYRLSTDFVVEVVLPT